MSFDMAIFGELMIPIVIAACLCFGYILKHWVKDADNKYIPTILAVIGAVLACALKCNVTIELIIGGFFSGLASTGFHQAFKQVIENE